MQFLKEAIEETLWATRCVICDEQGTLLCETCTQNLSYIDQNLACPRCGEPYGIQQCCSCTPYSPSFTSGHSVVLLDERARAIVRAYKDQGEQRLAAFMGQSIAQLVSPEERKAIQLITHIPATKSAYRRRGFDHAEKIAQEVSLSLTIPAYSVFMRPKNIDQRKLGRKGRLSNMKGRFKVLPGISLPHTILLVDDVFTTGATLCAATETLKEAGVAQVFCATFARTY